MSNTLVRNATKKHMCAEMGLCSFFENWVMTAIQGAYRRRELGIQGIKNG